MICKLVVFDLDGTLVEFPYSFLLDETERVLAAIGFPRVAREVLQSSFAAFDFFRFVEHAEREHFLEKFWKEFNWDNHPPLVPLPGALEVLKSLAAIGIPCVIATARAISREKLIEHLHPTGFLPYLSQIETRECETLDWRDKRPQLKRIVEAQQVPLENILAIGDVPPDTATAHALGIRFTAAVLSGGIDRHVLQAVGPRWLAADVAAVFKQLTHEGMFALRR